MDLLSQEWSHLKDKDMLLLLLEMSNFPHFEKSLRRKFFLVTKLKFPLNANILHKPLNFLLLGDNILLVINTCHMGCWVHLMDLFSRTSSGHHVLTHQSF